MSVEIIQWNCRSLKNKLLWIQQKLFCAANILVFQETFLSQNDHIHILNKAIFRNDRTDGRGGGLLIAVDKKFPAQEIHFPNSPASSNQVLIVKVHVDNWNLTIANIYSPRGKFSINWLTQLKNHLNFPCLILGDFNIKHSVFGSSTTSPDSDTVINWILDNQLCLVNTTTPTHYKPNCTPSLIDLTISSPDIYPNLQHVVFTDMYDSDHCPIKVAINNISSHNLQTRSRTRWDLLIPALNTELEHSCDLSLSIFQNTCKKSLQKFRVDL